MISLVLDPSLEYPEANDFYSPDERFPEYPYDHISEIKNPVYRAVRNCFAQAGFDREHFDTPTWNPLGTLIKPGSRVFVLGNFVFHRRDNESAENFIAKCTHGSVLRALIDYLLLAVGESGTVSFGNAAMQACNWEAVLRETGTQEVVEFYQSNDARAKLKDLRLFVIKGNRIGAIPQVERRIESDGVHIDLGADSLMKDLDCGPTTPYRVMNYNPSRTESFHAGGSHVYVINRHILEADVVVHLPKFKTHEKVGLTCALKGCVGAVGHKDSLPHYRYGSPDIQGDEFPSDRMRLLRKVSSFHGWTQHSAPDRACGTFWRTTDRIVRRALRSKMPISEGAWWGNDTAWRMVLDLARVVTYATATGELQSNPVRKQFALIDGIIGGEGNGPLFPTAVHSGLLLFGDNPLSVDYASALLMGFDPERMPMLREALKLNKYPLVNHSLDDELVTFNGKTSSISELTGLLPRHYRPSQGWQGHI